MRFAIEIFEKSHPPPIAVAVVFVRGRPAIFDRDAKYGQIFLFPLPDRGRFRISVFLGGFVPRVAIFGGVDLIFISFRFVFGRLFWRGPSGATRRRSALSSSSLSPVERDQDREIGEDGDMWGWGGGL